MLRSASQHTERVIPVSRVYIKSLRAAARHAGIEMPVYSTPKGIQNILLLQHDSMLKLKYRMLALNLYSGLLECVFSINLDQSHERQNTFTLSARNSSIVPRNCTCIRAQI